MAATARKSLADRYGSNRLKLFRAQLLRYSHYLGPQRGIAGAVGVFSSSNQYIQVPPGLPQKGQHLGACDLAKPSLETIPFDDAAPMLGHDQPQTWTRKGGSREEDVQVRRPLPLPLPEEPTDFGRPLDPARTRQPLRRGAAGRTRSRAARVHRLTLSRSSPPSVPSREHDAWRVWRVHLESSCAHGTHACLHAYDFVAYMLASCLNTYSLTRSLNSEHEKISEARNRGQGHGTNKVLETGALRTLV